MCSIRVDFLVVDLAHSQSIAEWSVNPGEKRESLGLISNITNELASNQVVKDRELLL